jgi:WhiB family transcriptional regulator, redox-sensing transcriptional regulator
MTAQPVDDTVRDWRARAECLHVDPDLFHPGSPGSQPEPGARHGQPDPYAAAKRICATCPVAGECLEEALATQDPWGVRGGLDWAEREALLARRVSLTRRAPAGDADAAVLVLTAVGDAVGPLLARRVSLTRRAPAGDGGLDWAEREGL